MTRTREQRTTTLPSGATITDRTGEQGAAPVLRYELEGEKLTIVFMPEQGDWNNIRNRQDDVWRIQYEGERTSEHAGTLEEAVRAAETMASSALESRREKKNRDRQDSERRREAVRNAAGQVERLFQGA